MNKCLTAIECGMGLNAASRHYGIPKPTIRRHRLGINKYATGDTKHRGGPCILPPDVENELVQHIKQLDELFFGVTTTELKKLAYQVSCAHGIHRFSESKQSANKTWYYNFMRRHPELSLRSPEATSLGRMRGFNRQDVGDFFDKYYQLLEEHGFTADKMYNMDETGHSTVQTPSKVLSVKGKRQVGAATSAERGTNTTGVYCHSATGHFIPPLLIFKRKRMTDSLKEGAPNGTVFACTDSGWIDLDVFVQWFQHFIQCVKPSPQNKHLLILDGHCSHSKNLEAIKLARENGVVILSFPAHTTHRLQPLDVTVFKSFKTWYNIEIENYLRSSQGTGVGVHLVSRFVNKAFLKAATMETAVNGFRKTGLWPPNRHVFHAEFNKIEAALRAASPGEILSTSPNPDQDTTTYSAEHGRHMSTSDEHQSHPATPEQTAVSGSGVSGPGVSGPEVSGQGESWQGVSGQGVSGPAVSGQGVTGQGVSGQGVSGPEVSAQRVSGPEVTYWARNGQSTHQEPSATAPTSVPSSEGKLHSVPTKGDGRCFFRAISIGLNPELQSSERNIVSGDILDPIKSILETAQADSLRGKVIAHMCTNLRVEPGAATLSADMPRHLQFQTVADRILHMSHPQAMVGELEIQNTAEVLERPVHVFIEGTGHVAQYTPRNGTKGHALSVKYIPHEDAGHYEAMTARPTRIGEISPLPKMKEKKRKAPASSKAQVFTSSPYKKILKVGKH